MFRRPLIGDPKPRSISNVVLSSSNDRSSMRVMLEISLSRAVFSDGNDT